MELPLPDRTNLRTLELCRQYNKEKFIKTVLRDIYSRYLKWKFNFTSLGEGFRWGKSWKLRKDSNISIGHFVYIGPYVQIIYPLVIGDLTIANQIDHQIENTEYRILYPISELIQTL